MVFGGEICARLQFKFPFSSDSAKRTQRRFRREKTPDFSAVLLASKCVSVRNWNLRFLQRALKRNPETASPPKKRIPSGLFSGEMRAMSQFKCAIQTSLKKRSQRRFRRNKRKGFGFFFFWRRIARHSANKIRIFFRGR